MTRTLDVLVLENRRGVGDEAVRSLEAAGHTVHRCHDADDRGFPCRGVLDPDGCPIDGHVDVAVLVRRSVTPRPTPLEDGVSCAVRAGVPIVEEGPEALDPFEPWIATRVRPDGDLVVACALAADRSFDPLRDDVRTKIGPLLHAAGLDPSEVGCDVQPAGSALDVHLDVPVAIDSSLEQALGVRVLDAVRSGGRGTYPQVHVQVHHPGR